jgi:serine/threonine protein kinase
VLITLIAIPVGGLTSRFVQGVALFVFARAVLIPSHWKSALAISLGSALMMPLTMAAAALWSAPLRMQWISPPALLVFLHNGLFVLGAAVVGSVGSHVLWTARTQVYEMRRLGSYRLRTRIGGGGVGDVWLAWQDPPGREVALKVLRDEALKDPDLVRRFEREARAVRRLEHPNTIRIFDYGASHDGVHYIAMELLHGLDVDALVRKYGPMPAARVIHLARQACGSLDEAHGMGIIHRDLKPANLFVVRADDGGDMLKVLDFGLVRILRSATSSSPSPVTPEGVICGTPAFISPEAVSGDRVDGRSDVYSLGAVLYFMLTGTVVFPHLTITESVMAHAGRAPEPPSKRLAGVPADLERLILRCLEKDPANRYASAAALAADLARCADAEMWSVEDARAFWESGRTPDHSATQLARR